MLAEQRADVADDAGAVFVLEEKQHAFGLGFDVASVDHDDARFRSEKRSRGRGLRPGVFGDDLDEIAEFGAVADPRLDDLESEVLRQPGGVDFVDLVAADLGEETFEHGAGDRRGVEVAGLAAVDDAQDAAAFGRDLRDEASEALAEAEVGSEHGERLGVDARGVDRIVDRAVEEGGADGVGDFDADAFLGLGRGGAEVRGEDDIGRVAQGVLRGGRFLLEDVDGRAGHMARSEGVGQGLLVDQAAAGAVDDARAFFQLGQPGGIEHVLGFVGQRHVHGDEIGVREGVLEIFDQFDLQGLGAGLGEVRIVGQDAHAEGEGALGHFGADAAHAEDGEGFAVEFDALETFAVPLARLHAGVGLGDFAGDRNEEGEGVLGGRHRVAAGGVHHDDAAPGRRLDIDIVHPDAGPADRFEIFRRGDDVRADFGLAANDKGGVVGDDFEQFVVREARMEGHVQQSSFGQGIDAGLRDGIGDKNFGFGHGKRRLDAHRRGVTLRDLRGSGRGLTSRPPCLS